MADNEVRNAALGVGVDIDLARTHWLFAAGPQGRTRNPQSPPGAARLHSGPGDAEGGPGDARGRGQGLIQAPPPTNNHPARPPADNRRKP